MSFNIDSLLDASLDSIDDLPSTSAWPVGAHVCAAKLEISKKDPKKPMIIARLTLISTEEQADDSVPPAKPGDQYSFMYGLMLKDGSGRNEYSVQQLKTYFGNPLVAKGDLSEAATLSELVDAYKDGVELLVTTGQRPYNGEQQMTLKSSEAA